MIGKECGEGYVKGTASAFYQYVMSQVWSYCQHRYGCNYCIMPPTFFSSMVVVVLSCCIHTLTRNGRFANIVITGYFYEVFFFFFFFFFLIAARSFFVFVCYFFFIQSSTPIQSYTVLNHRHSFVKMRKWLTHYVSETYYSIGISLNRSWYHISIKIVFAKHCHVQSDYIALMLQQITETPILKQIMILPSINLIWPKALIVLAFGFYCMCML